MIFLIFPFVRFLQKHWELGRKNRKPNRNQAVESITFSVMRSSWSCSRLLMLQRHSFQGLCLFSCFLITINYIKLRFVIYYFFNVSCRICCFVIFVFVADFGVRTVQWFVIKGLMLLIFCFRVLSMIFYENLLISVQCENDITWSARRIFRPRSIDVSSVKISWSF